MSYDKDNYASENESETGYSPNWKKAYDFLFEYPEPFGGEENENI